jgi:hypothetical protein
VTAGQGSAQEQGREQEAVVGTLAPDTRTQKVGRVMERGGSLVFLRPPGGGVEWTASPSDLEPVAASDGLSARVTEENARSRRGKRLGPGGERVQGRE